MLRPFSKTSVGRSPAATVISSLLLCVSCGPAERGYWTKQGMSQAHTDEQYATDSPHCERFAAQNDGRESERARNKRYAKCMSARDYQWVVREKPVSLPEQSGQSTHPPSCPAGSNCNHGGTKDGGLKSDVNQSITRGDSAHQNTTNVSPDPSQHSNEQRRVNDWECRQQADATLSSPYAVYANCMQEKESASPPAIKPPLDLAENDKQDTDKGHARENIGLQSAARDMGRENQKIVSRTGKMSTADSGANAKQDPSLGQEIGLGVQKVTGNIGSGFTKIGSALGRPFEAVGRGLQNVFRNIGDEIAKIGSRIGNLFKRLGGDDRRDEDKDRKPNRLIAAPPEGDIG